MKHRRFSDEQVIGVLKEHEAGAKVDDICRAARHQHGDILHLSEEVRRHGGRRATQSKAAARARGGERQAEAVRTKRRSKLPRRDRIAPQVPERPMQRWSLDFISDQLADCRRFP
jgi:hypothetical protein